MEVYTFFYHKRNGNGFLASIRFLLFPPFPLFHSWRNARLLVSRI